MDRDRCVVCRAHDQVERYRPFCSERCRLVDLGRWLGGDYRVASAATADDMHEDALNLAEGGGNPADENPTFGDEEETGTRWPTR